MPLRHVADKNSLRPVEDRVYPRDLGGLLAQLGDADPAVRRWAARDLAQEPKAAAAVCARVTQEGDASVRAVLFSSAAQIGGAPVVQAMIALLRHDDASLRHGALEVLSSLPEAVAPHIDGLLQDADSDVRILAVNLLGHLRHPKVPHWLSSVLVHEPVANVVGAALEVLAEAGTPDSLPALQSAKARFPDDDYILFSADLAIARIATP